MTSMQPEWESEGQSANRETRVPVQTTFKLGTTHIATPALGHKDGGHGSRHFANQTRPPAQKAEPAAERLARGTRPGATHASNGQSAIRVLMLCYFFVARLLLLPADVLMFPYFVVPFFDGFCATCFVVPFSDGFCATFFVTGAPPFFCMAFFAVPCCAAVSSCYSSVTVWLELAGHVLRSAEGPCLAEHGVHTRTGRRASTQETTCGSARGLS